MVGLSSPAFVLIVVSSFAVFSSMGAVIPVLPRYVTGPLGGDGSAVGVVVAAFFVATLCARPLAGRLGDERGRRVLIAGGAALVALSVAAFPFAGNVATLVVLRLVQGAGQAAFYVGAVPAVIDLVPAARRSQAVSYFSAALYAGLALGPLAGEAVLGGGNYGRVWVLAALLAGLGAACGVALREQPRARAPRPAGRRARLVHGPSLIPGAAFGLATFGYVAFAAFMPLYARTLGLSGSAAVFACFAGLTLAGRVFLARLPDRVGAARTALGGMATMAAGMAMIGAWPSVTGLWAGTILFGAGNAFMFPSVLSLALAAASERERGAVVATVTAFFDVGQGVGALLLGPLVAVTGYSAPFLAGAVAAAGGFAVLSAHLRHTARSGEEPHLRHTARSGEERRSVPAPAPAVP